MQAVVVEELAPSRIEVDDSAAIRASLEEYGFACVRGAVTSDELTHARDLLWKFLEGDEAPRMTQRRPVGWKRGQPTTWVEGHGDALMTSTTHNESMWFVRSRPGVLAGFAAAYGVPESQLVADFDRMSINLPTSSGNDAALRVAERRYQHGKLGVAQEMHTHWTEYYGADHTNYYSIVPLFDMNQMTGATALVPGSHKKVEEIQSARAKNWIGTGKDRRWVGKGSPFIEPFSSNGLMPVVTNVKAGDMVLFDTATFHVCTKLHCSWQSFPSLFRHGANAASCVRQGGCSAEDPSGASGNGPNELLRAIYILGMNLLRLQTPEVLEARRRAYELDIFWPPPFNHQELALKILSGDPSVLEGLEPACQKVEVRKFADAPREVQVLIDPSWRLPKM
jgi:hypothetical protein